MNKIFTQQPLKRLIHLALAAIACAILILYSNVVNAVSPPVSINVQAKNVKCYPNPAISFINFEVSQKYVNKNYVLQVFSFTGKKMYETTLTTSKLMLTFSNDYYRGIYVFQLRDASGKIVETGKFQINK